MADLISRAAALDVLVTSPNFNTTLTRIEELPAVDAVPVVRCKDCKHWYMEHCAFGGACATEWTLPDWFCADGERRKNDGADA